LNNKVEAGESKQEFNNNNVEYDKFSIPVWLDGDSLPNEVGTVDGNNPDCVPVLGNADPLVNCTLKGFGLSFTDAQPVETKLLKMLNDIQAPKYMYSSILKWACEGHRLGYNFIPCRGGTKDSLVNCLQLQLHLDHFRPKHIRIKLPGDGLEVEVTRFNFMNGLHLLQNHPDLTGSLDNLDINPDNPFGNYESSGGRLGPVNSGMW
jgi:hypothetical protein